MKNYDILIIGAGPGGYVAAIKAAQLGAKVAIIEKEAMGGICLNHGCIPTKTFLKSAKVYKEVKQAKDYGVLVSGDVSFSWTKMMERKNKVVNQLTTGVAYLLKKNKVDVYQGLAEVVSKSEIKVGAETLFTKNLIIATGATAIVPPIPGVKEAYEKGIVVTSRELLQINEAPKSLIIVGGGVIGVEFATLFSSLGSKVTIIEKMPGILPTIDDSVREAYVKILKNDGIEILTSAEVKSVHNKDLTYLLDGKEVKISADTILLSVGTKANTQGLEKLNLNIERGNVITNEFLETNIKNVYAIGDVNGKFMLAHTASHEGIIAVERIINQTTKGIHYGRIPQCIYGAPEIASIGLTEKEAKDQNLDYKVSTFPLAGNGKALADNEKDGFIKMIVDQKYKEILGVHIFAYNATDMIAEIALSMELEGTTHEIAHTVHPHPTLSEIVHEAALGDIAKAIHI